MLTHFARLVTHLGQVPHMQNLLLIALLITLSACAGQIKSQDKPRDYFQQPHLATQESPTPVRTGADKKKILEKRFEVIETGLEPMVNKLLGSDYGPAGVWLNENLLLTNSIQDAVDADQKRMQRVVIFDLKNRSATTLLPNERMKCWNRETHFLVAAELTYTRQTKTRVVKLDENGKLDLNEVNADIDIFRCRPKAFLRDKNSYRNAPLGVDYDLLESDGIIRRVFDVTPGNRNNTDKTFWIRPDDTVKELSVRGSEVSHVLYLPHLQKYLLNWRDSQGNSDTDRRLGGGNWNRPYALAPYHLMGRDGSIEDIPYPTFIYDYGIRYFGILVPTKVGNVLIAPNSSRSEYGLFLLQGENVYRFFGGPRAFGLDGREGVDKLSVSPDGCKIAFNLYSDHRAKAKQIMIINLCNEVPEK
jgi:hypothetical protein